MSFWTLPLGLELATSLFFVSVLIYLRKSLKPRGVALWALVWIMRGAASLFALRYLSGPERVALVMYAPLQIAFAVALVIIAIRLENQKEVLRTLNDEIARLRKAASDQVEIDPLTGLHNRAALTRWMEREPEFRGLAVVCDMDDFKPLNDIYGHLVGDEILSGVGRLIRGSIRDDDLAFRWGGDEFVIFFRSEDSEMVQARMRSIEERLRAFHIRQHGQGTVGFSWGLAPVAGALRDSLAEADRRMYEAKRGRRLNVNEAKA
jgi:diguanylate cyclase (GGDEF)-like protein